MSGATTSNETLPVILFGAYDRHNFGDLLFAHVVSALLAPVPVTCAALAARDLRFFGGHETVALPDLCKQLEGKPVTFIHAGGELLTCSAWEAAVMLLPQEEVIDTMCRFDGRPQDAHRWACQYLGTEELAPYTVRRSLLPAGSRIIYNAVGGTDLDAKPAALRFEVTGKLRDAEHVSVRDKVTQRLLREAGILADLVPDPVAMVRELFDGRIAAHAESGEVRRVRDACPHGHIAVQCSSDFGDDATLDSMAAELDRHAASSGHGVVFFRAGAAPLHDDVQIYRRLAARMQVPAHLLQSLDIWDICALIACSKACIGSSLHGRIVAMAYGVPRVGLEHAPEPQRIGKQRAYAQTWEMPGMPHVVQVHETSAALSVALGIGPDAMIECARQLAARTAMPIPGHGQRKKNVWLGVAPT